MFFEVIGYDAFEGSREKARAAGVTVAETLREVAEKSDDTVVSMVRDYAQNVDVILSENVSTAERASGHVDRVEAARPYFAAVGAHTFYYGSNPGNSQAAKLVRVGGRVGGSAARLLGGRSARRT